MSIGMASFGSKKILCLVFFSIALLTASNNADESAERIKRAIGGRAISRGHWPWLALMRATIVTRRLFGIPIDHNHLYCGGVLISDRWLLSAAHCFTEFGRQATRASNWEARLATVRLRAGLRERLLDLIGRVFDFDELRNWEVDVDRIVIHPQYNASGMFTNDIALIKLSSSVPSSRRFSLIQAISLPSENEQDFPIVGEECITKGWGCTSRGGGASQQAHQIAMPVYPSSTCNRHYSLPMDKRICAGHENSGVGVCPGDSGSPLVCRRGSGYKLAGLVSLTSRDNPGNYPAIFTSVKDYIPWIQNVMRRY